MSLHPNDPIIFVFEPHSEWARDQRVRVVPGRVIAVFDESWFNTSSIDYTNAVGSFHVRDEGVTWSRLDSDDNRDALLAAYRLSESEDRERR